MTMVKTAVCRISKSWNNLLSLALAALKSSHGVFLKGAVDRVPRYFRLRSSQQPRKLRSY